MNNLWYKKLGFENNPFSIKPAAFDDNIIAYDMEFLYDKIENGELLFLEGDYGSGKTTILRNIIEEFRGYNKIIYYSFNAGQPFDLQKLIRGANSFIRKVTGLHVKNIIMLLDEVHTMNKSDAEEILNEYRDGILQSIIFVTHDYNLVNLPDEMKELLDGNVIQTVNLSQREAIELVRNRIGRLGLLTNKVIIRLFKLADKNPRRLLEYCEDVTRYAVEIGDDKVTKFHINEVLGDVIQEKKNREKKKKQKKSKKEVSSEKKEEKKIEKEESKEKETKEEKKSSKGYKVNKLVVDTKENPYGQVKQKENDDIPEYNVILFDD